MNNICDKIYLRNLSINDAKVSVAWRNDVNVWLHTKNRPTKRISVEDEEKWIKSVTYEPNSFRYAILFREGNEYTYIGNVQITNVVKNTGEFHIFIGDRFYWGKGIGYCATRLMCYHAFINLNFYSLYLLVNRNNSPAINTYLNSDFIASSNFDDFIRMQLLKNKFTESLNVKDFNFFTSRLFF